MEMSGVTTHRKCYWYLDTDVLSASYDGNLYWRMVLRIRAVVLNDSPHWIFEQLKQHVVEVWGDIHYLDWHTMFELCWEQNSQLYWLIMFINDTISCTKLHYKWKAETNAMLEERVLTSVMGKRWVSLINHQLSTISIGISAVLW